MLRRAATLALTFCLVCRPLPADAKELTSIGVSVSTLANPYFTALVRGLTQEAHTINPNVKITALSADYELNKQFEQIDGFISAGVDLIILVASDPRVVAPAVKRAQAAGIVVVAVDVSAQGADATVQTDNRAAGVVGCQNLAEQIGKKGNVVILNGPQVSSIVDRVAGCKEALGHYPAIKLLSSDQDAKANRDGGLAAMQGLLTRFPDLQGVFSITDQQTLGAELAAKQFHRTQLTFVSVDGAPDAIAEMRRGSLLKATVAQNPALIGKTGVDVGVELLHGHKPDHSVLLLQPTLVTQDTVAAYQGW